VGVEPEVSRICATVPEVSLRPPGRVSLCGAPCIVTAHREGLVDFPEVDVLRPQPRVLQGLGDGQGRGGGELGSHLPGAHRGHKRMGRHETSARRRTQCPSAPKLAPSLLPLCCGC